MKKFLMLVLIAALTVPAYASRKQNTGCGLGSMMIDKSKQGMWWDVLVATLNGSSGNQTFGISSGTSNCTNYQSRRTRAEAFIEANSVALANDIARGNGETLEVLAAIYGCEDTQAVGPTLQENYSELFAEQAELTDQIQKVLKEADLSCGGLS